MHMAAITYFPYLPRRCQNSNRGIWKATHAIFADLYTVAGYERALERRYFAPHKFLYFPNLANADREELFYIYIWNMEIL